MGTTSHPGAGAAFSGAVASSGLDSDFGSPMDPEIEVRNGLRATGGRRIRTAGPVYRIPRLFRERARRQNVERVGLELLFDFSGTESSDLEPATGSVRSAISHVHPCSCCWPQQRATRAVLSAAPRANDPVTPDMLNRHEIRVHGLHEDAQSQKDRAAGSSPTTRCLRCALRVS
jgi:hypothetical protein